MITTAVAVAGLAGGITSSLRQHGQLPQIPGGGGSFGRRQAG